MAKDPALSTVPILIMVNKIDLIDEAFTNNYKDEGDSQRKKEAIDKNRKEVQD
jgi:ribosome biogenesis GTPase A